MKIMMVEGRYKGNIDLSNLDLSLIPKKIGLSTTVQFLDYVDEIKEYLQKQGISVFVDKMKQKYEGQLLGCDQGAAVKIKDNVDAFLYIGTGIFHPLQMFQFLMSFCNLSHECWRETKGILNLFKFTREIEWTVRVPKTRLLFLRSKSW